jgi:serine beta-lactamase-like protein LACTB, mitochondrial
MRFVHKQIVFLICMFSFLSTLFGQQKGFKKADRILTKLVKRKKVPGIAVSVSKGGLTLYSKGFGYADLENKILVNPVKTIFRIGSISKPIAATGLLRMVEKNQIKLNNSIKDYVPYFPNKKYDFTIKQLGGHLAGIRNYKGNEFMNTKPLSIKEGVALFQDDLLLFQPGKNFNYTSYGWNLLSLAMQEVSEKPFENIIKDEVLVPLKMLHTFADRQEKINNKAIFYHNKINRKFKVAKPVDNYFKLAGGGYLSTSEDILKLGNAYLSGDIYSRKISAEFVNSQKTEEEKTYYGIGWQASYDAQNRPYFGHVGNGLGGYGIFYVYPKDNIVISILMNCSNPKQDKKLDKVINAIFSELLEN